MDGYACSSSSRLFIDLSAIRWNYRVLATRVAPAQCAAVVKADAYGLGVAKVAPALLREGCNAFFVAQLCEALALRDTIGDGATIFILNGLDPGQEEICANFELVPILNSARQIARWRQMASSVRKVLPAGLQVDSGMSRFGVDTRTACELAGDPAFKDEIALRLVMTHFACADEPEHQANDLQLKRFQLVRDLFPDVPASVANSAGSFLPEASKFDMARPGIALYGSSPVPIELAIRPVVRLEAKVVQVREVSAGAGVGYGLDYVAPGPLRLATVGIGYADGWPRATGGTGSAWFAGQRLPICGRVSMDSITVDITSVDVDVLGEGDFVELLGPSQSIDCVARDAKTIPNEVLTGLGRRPRRIYLAEDPIMISAQSKMPEGPATPGTRRALSRGA